MAVLGFLLVAVASLYGTTTAGTLGTFTGFGTSVSLCLGISMILNQRATSEYGPRTVKSRATEFGGWITSLSSPGLAAAFGWKWGWMGALLGIVAGEVACQLKGGESALFPNKDAHSNQARGGHPPNTAEPNNTPDQNDSIQEEPDDEVVLEDQLIPGPKVHFNVQSEDEVELMLEVERRYKEVLHSKTGRYGGCWYRPSEILPFAKETIEAALVTLVCIAEGLYADAVLGFVEDSEVTAHRRRLVRSLGRFVDCPAAILPSDPEKNREFVRDLGIVAPKPEDPEATTYPLW